jgi:hypothetical protein
MKSFTVLQGVVAPMDRANVDTDLIIPKQFLKSIKRSGFGPNLFDELRYLDEGQPGQDCSGRWKTTASAVSSRPASPIFSTITVARTAYCRSRWTGKWWIVCSMSSSKLAANFGPVALAQWIKYE